MGVGVDPRGPRRHPRPLRHHLLPLQVRILQTSAT